MNQVPNPGYPVQGAAALPYPNMGMPEPAFLQPGHLREGMLDGRQRKWSLQPFDGKEICHCLDSDLLEHSKEFVRQVV